MRSHFKVADVLEMERDQISSQTFTGWHRRTLHAIRRCRTPAMGGHIDKCDCCHKLHISYNSCRNRHCPTCQGHKRESWIRARESELLGVPYFHVVFTLPPELNIYALSYPKIIYGSLFKAAWATLVQFGANPKHLGARTGMIAILHTWGQNLSLHPHLHCIVPGGGVNRSGKWKPAKNKGKYLFNVISMSGVFRAKYVALLRKEKVPVPQEIFNKLFDKNWVVYAKQQFHTPKYVVEYLGRYTHKIAISNYRIKQLDKADRTVTFQMKNYKKGGRKELLKLSTHEFVRRFALHVLPKGFTRIRHYGILSSGWKKEKLPALQKALATVPITSKEERPPLLNGICPSCKKGKLVTVMTFDGRGPPQGWKELLHLDGQYPK
tara:strand:+ start:133 stop:1269 length:1137 start_codon:yes stop_codon:yes gene_type:complete